MDIFHEFSMTLKYDHWAKTSLGQCDEAFIDEFQNKLRNATQAFVDWKFVAALGIFLIREACVELLIYVLETYGWIAM